MRNREKAWGVVLVSLLAYLLTGRVAAGAMMFFSAIVLVIFDEIMRFTKEEG